MGTPVRSFFTDKSLASERPFYQPRFNITTLRTRTRNVLTAFINKPLAG